MAPAFVSSTPLKAVTTQLKSTCMLRPATDASSSVQQPPARTALTMRCRRDLKKEKSLRNLEFSRQHRKRPAKNINRRQAQQAVADEDNQILASLYGTIQFTSESAE